MVSRYESRASVTSGDERYWNRSSRSYRTLNTLRRPRYAPLSVEPSSHELRPQMHSARASEAGIAGPFNPAPPRVGLAATSPGGPYALYRQDPSFNFRDGGPRIDTSGTTSTSGASAAFGKRVLPMKQESAPSLSPAGRERANSGKGVFERQDSAPAASRSGSQQVSRKASREVRSRSMGTGACMKMGACMGGVGWAVVWVLI